MNLSELSRRSGCSTASIKFYRREGILPPGRRITATRQDYGENHLARIELVQALREVAGLGIAEIRAITQQIDAGASLVEVVRAAHSAVLGLPTEVVADAVPQDDLTGRLIRSCAWPDVPTPARAALVGHLAQMAEHGIGPSLDQLTAYASTLDVIARDNIDELTRASSLDDAVRRVAVAAATQYRLVTLVLALAQTSHTIATAGPESAVS